MNKEERINNKYAVIAMPVVDRNINNNLALIKMQKTLLKMTDDDSDSSLDDLNGWDYSDD